MAAIKLSIIEDDQTVSASLESYMATKPDVQIVSKNTSVESFIQLLNTDLTVKPEILLLDIQLPGLSGIEGIPYIRKKLPDVNIIMLTTFEEPDKIFSALCAGACSYLSKQSTLSDIYSCVITVHNGGSYMSPTIAKKVIQFFGKNSKQENPLSARHMEVVNCIVDGLSYKMIGAQLGISIDTVRSHIMQIYRTLNIHSKGELIKWALDKS
jgi:DNA-binding NarL/FixJ family response regulator